jgi:hypothetical protein
MRDKRVVRRIIHAHLHIPAGNPRVLIKAIHGAKLALRFTLESAGRGQTATQLTSCTAMMVRRD